MEKQNWLSVEEEEQERQECFNMMEGQIIMLQEIFGMNVICEKEGTITFEGHDFFFPYLNAAIEFMSGMIFSLTLTKGIDFNKFMEVVEGNGTVN